MAFKFVVFLAALACANAGLIGAPAAVAYSPASAVSHSYISQAAAPVAYAAPVAHAAYAAPVAHAAYAAPAYSAYAAPVATYAHAPAVGASHQSVVRSLGGNQAVSHYSKAVDSAFSTVRKYDTRITNDAVYAAPVAHAAYAAPIAHAAYAAPVAHAAYAAPVAHAAYAAPAYGAYAAAPVAHAAYAAPVAHAAYAAPVVAKAAVAYSPASVVSHSTFSGYGINYGW